jgi:integrase
MVIFGAATGLRPSELFGLEQRDVDRKLGVVYVRRAYANGRLKHTKMRLSTRAVPLQAKVLEALDQLPASDNPILFPSMRGSRIDFRIFGRKLWRPAQIKAGTDPVRGDSVVAAVVGEVAVVAVADALAFERAVDAAWTLQ